MKKLTLCSLMAIAGLAAAGVTPVQAAPAYNNTSYTNNAYAAPVNPTYDRAGRNDFGFQVGGALSEDSVDDALYAGLQASRGLNSWLAFGVEGGWQEADFDLTNDEDLTMITVFGDIIARLNLPDSPLVPYGVVGLGALHAYTDTNTDDDDETAFAAKLGGGIDLFLTQNWIVNFEAAYITTGADIHGDSGLTEDLDHWRAVAGLKYAF